MNVYIETNFILELAFLQEQHEGCDRIAALAEAENVKLVLPAFCIAESYETLARRGNRRAQIASDLARELHQLSRSKPYKDEIDASENISGLLARSSQEEAQRLVATLKRVLSIAEIIPLEAGVVLEATKHRAAYKLKPQDSIIYSSVLQHLAEAGAVESCFLNRNRRDFDDRDIEERLSAHGCKMLFSFEKGYHYIQHRIDPNGQLTG